MVLKIENIGIVKKAEIKLKGITLIAGQNDSGKSTVGKVLYALIRGVNVYENDKVFYNRIGEFLSMYSTWFFVILAFYMTSRKLPGLLLLSD